ncbi:MAG: hypothetical protein PHC70_02295 [Patescibacteria group bacterium]|jgi:hypothetical protein|nr:hypothetical protein [Patescibacteria group bacterium]
MSFEGHQPYLNKEGYPVDFEKKRFEFWTQKVPYQIRRWEYDLWRCYKTLSMIDYRDYTHLNDRGRPVPVPGYSDDIKEKDWQEFRDSFLTGENRKKRFLELISQIKSDWNNVLHVNEIEIPENEIGIVALEGSGFYGPRKSEAFMSDIDIKILLDRSDNGTNFEIMPSIKNLGKPFYHVIGTGNTDGARFHREEIHWLLYPHFPVVNKYSIEQLDAIIEAIVKDTFARQSQIEQKIAALKTVIEKRKEDIILK